MRDTSIGRVLTSSVILGIVVAVVHIGCGAPEDPGAPDAPDAAMDIDGTSACFGIADGAPCSNGTKLCVRGVCSDPSCGDGIVTAPEECDRGALNAPGSGCETTCKHTCVSTDAARNCQTSDSCATSGSCDDATHICKLGGPKPTGASCGQGKFCKGAECVDALCGDAVVTPPETCDNGDANGPGTGCEKTCKQTCVNPLTDCPATPCNIATCTADHRCATTPDATKNGQACAASLVCKAGACIAPGATCGNGILEGGEECDAGASNGPGSGCETICKFSCSGPGTQGSCVDMNACHAAPTCTAVTIGGNPGQKCVTGANKADGVTCGVGSICLASVCKPSVCGDGYRDAAKNEQCDDGNVTKLDACDNTCKFEQSHRVIGMRMQFGTDAYCTTNALGSAIAGVARTSFQDSLDAGIKDGSVSALFTFAGDLAGATGPVTVGNISGAPPSNAAPYDGVSDLDWWYAPTPSSIDATRTARAKLTGTYAGGALDATGHLNLITSVGGSLASLAVSGAKITIPIGAANVPTTAAAAAPPGHVASEHLVSTLQSFSSAGGTAGAPTGQMCGNIAATSLDQTAAPLSFLPGGANPCFEKYTTANRLIDIIVSGCKVTALKITAIKPTQPDQADPDVTPAGAGAPYALSADPTTKRVTGCKDKNGAVVPLQACLNAAAYSMSFKYATDRVIIR
ncbi:MAG: Multiple EGF-like-domain protein 3 precursor [Labilithrix sp.]|nr:Multiple EGF-like-domain protein 3 precursor [Labilithrix sp.]